MTLSLSSFTRFWLRAVSLLLPGTGLLVKAQSNATPAIRYVCTNGPNTNPAKATTWAASTSTCRGALR